MYYGRLIIMLYSLYIKLNISVYYNYKILFYLNKFQRSFLFDINKHIKYQI